MKVINFIFSKCKCRRRYPDDHDHKYDVLPMPLAPGSGSAEIESVPVVGNPDSWHPIHPDKPESTSELPSVPGSGSSEIEFVPIGPPNYWPPGHPYHPESAFPEPEVLIESKEVPEEVPEGVTEGVPGVSEGVTGVKEPEPTEEPINTSCLENYETAKERFYAKTGGKKSNHLMLEMDDCIKSKLMEPGRCTMEKFKGIYSKCEKGIIGEIKEFIEDDEKVHEMYDFEHDKSI